MLKYRDYVASHENLEKLHLTIECSLLQREEDDIEYGQKFFCKLLPVKKHTPINTNLLTMTGEIKHLRHSSILYYNHKVQLSQQDAHFSNFQCTHRIHTISFTCSLGIK